MTESRTQQSPFKWRHFEAEIIVLCVRWYLRYALSYRDLEEMMAERGRERRSYYHLPLGPAVCS
jgi:transposase-like protein